jgi:microcystin-dependent protein
MNPYIGEIKLVSFPFAPKGWALCNGGILNVSQNQALFAILGTTFGGNGTTTFGLPDFRGRTALYTGKSYVLGQAAGEELHTLLLNEIPLHNHSGIGSSNAPNQAPPGGNYWATQALYSGPPVNTPMAPNAVGLAGGSQGHENRSPYLTINYIIALVGIFPSRN